MAALVSGHPVPKSIEIHFHPCNLVLLPQNTCKFICVFGGIWQDNVEIREEMSMISHNSVSLMYKLIV